LLWLIIFSTIQEQNDPHRKKFKEHGCSKGIAAGHARTVSRLIRMLKSARMQGISPSATVLMEIMSDTLSCYKLITALQSLNMKDTSKNHEDRYFTAIKGELTRKMQSR
jgi:hypothetical protein